MEEFVHFREITIVACAHWQQILTMVSWLQVLTSIGNFCICSIAVGMAIEIIVIYGIHGREYRTGIDNLLVLLIGGIPIAMPTVLSVTMAIGSHRLSQQVRDCAYSTREIDFEHEFECNFS